MSDIKNNILPGSTAVLTQVPQASLTATARSSYDNRYAPSYAIDGLLVSTNVNYWHAGPGLYTWIQVFNIYIPSHAVKDKNVSSIRTVKF